EGKPLPSLSNLPGWAHFYLSPDGKTLYSHVAHGPDNKGERWVRAYDAATGKELFPPQGHVGQVWAVAASPDGKRLASAGAAGTVRVRSLSSGKLLHVFSRPGEAYSVAFSPDGKTLAAHWRKGPLSLFDVVSGAEVRKLVDDDLLGVAFSPDGALLATAGTSGTVRVWEVASGRPRRTFRSSGSAAFSPAFSPDGKVLAAGSEDGWIFLWDVSSGWQIRTPPKQAAAVRWVGFHPDGQSLAVAGQWKDNPTRIVDVATGKETHRLAGHEGGVVSGGWRADGKLLVTVGDTDGTLQVWNLGVTPP